MAHTKAEGLGGNIMLGGQTIQDKVHIEKLDTGYMFTAIGMENLPLAIDLAILQAKMWEVKGGKQNEPY